MFSRFLRLRGRAPLPMRHEPLFSRENRSFPEADKWELSEFVLRQLVPVVGVRPYPIDEQLLMCSTVAYFQPQLIVEWGTHLGVSARIFHEVRQLLALEAEIHSVDLPPAIMHEENIALQENRGRFVRGLPVTLHLGDGVSVARELVRAKRPSSALFFLDGDHAYDTVSRELAALRATAPSAAVLLHDTFNQGRESGYNVGPYRALMEFALEHDLAVHHAALGLPGMSLVYW